MKSALLCKHVLKASFDTNTERESLKKSWGKKAQRENNDELHFQVHQNKNAFQ